MDDWTCRALATGSFILPRKVTVLGRSHVRARMRAHPFMQGRKADPKVIRNLVPQKPAGQRYALRFFAKFIRPYCAPRSSPLLHNR